MSIVLIDGGSRKKNGTIQAAALHYLSQGGSWVQVLHSSLADLPKRCSRRFVGCVDIYQLNRCGGQWPSRRPCS